MNTTSTRSHRVATFVAGAFGVALAGGLLAGCGAGPQDEATAVATAEVRADVREGGGQVEEATPEVAAAPFTYAGEDGSTALDLLLRYDAEAEMSGKGENAYVTGIGGYTADDSKSEFWSLSVDGEPAKVGAGTLKTEDGQEITWTLETY